jgi:hypothetical protein
MRKDLATNFPATNKGRLNFGYLATVFWHSLPGEENSYRPAQSGSIGRAEQRKTSTQYGMGQPTPALGPGKNADRYGWEIYAERKESLLVTTRRWSNSGDSRAATAVNLRVVVM